MACGLSTFPFLTALEFAHACRVLADRACTCTTGLEGLEEGGEGGWSSIRLVTQVSLPYILYLLSCRRRSIYYLATYLTGN